MNRFQRCASLNPYYGYLNKFTPQSLRKYQAQRHYFLGRRGAYDTLVLKMAADHIGYQEDFNVRYRMPPLITNLSMRIAMLWFWVPCVFIMFFLGDMNRLFTPHQYYYPGRPNSDIEAPTRYETLYMIDKVPARF